MKGDNKMNLFSYSTLSSVCALLVGGFLILWPELAVTYLVIAIGALFFLPGILGIAGYFVFSHRMMDQNGKYQKGAFPIVALGSSLLGLWLMITPAFFVNILMYLLGGLLVFAGLKQLLSFMAIQSEIKIPPVCFLTSALVLGGGLLVLFNPFEAATVPFVLFGAFSVVYALADLFLLFRYRLKLHKKVDTEVQIIEE